VDDSLTLVTWNIGYAGLGREMDFFYDGGKQVRPARFLYQRYWNGISKQIKAYRDTCDFVLLQEVDILSKRSYKNNQLMLIGEILKDYHHSFAINYKVPYVPVPVARPMGKVNSGIAVFSKKESKVSERYAFKGNYSWPTRLFMLDRCFILNRYDAPGGKELVLINTHNSAFDDGELRREQLETLRSSMLEEYEKGNYVIAGGDWNMNPEGFLVYMCTTGDMHYRIEPEIEPGYFPEGWTWAFDQEIPSNRFLIESYLRSRTSTTTLDYFILSPNIELIDVSTEDLFFENSDHHPVTIKIRLDG
jgi:endonuclease/exonuclease/phosphatase family metal-dependent hydrolase